MSEDYQSPWQIEHERMLQQEAAKKRAHAQKERREFLRRLRLTRKSDPSLHALVKKQDGTDAKVQQNKAPQAGKGIKGTQGVRANQTKQTTKAQQTGAKSNGKTDGRPNEKAAKNLSSASNKPHHKSTPPKRPASKPSDLEDNHDDALARVPLFNLQGWGEELNWLTPLLKKSAPFLVVLLVIFGLSLYSLSPLNKISAFKVEGNTMVSSSEVAKASKLNMQASIYNIMTHKGAIEAKIVNSSARIQSAQIKLSFPNTIIVQVKEFANIGYVEQKGKAYNILANGTKVDESVTSPDKEVPNSLVLKDFSDSQIREFVLAYEGFAKSLQSLIRTVSLTPSQNTADFISLQMSDGNQVKVPLSQIEQKLPYYPNVAKHLTAPQTVDMEVGIFSKDTPSYNSEFADDNPAGLSKSLSASRAASSASSSSGAQTTNGASMSSSDTTSLSSN